MSLTRSSRLLRFDRFLSAQFHNRPSRPFAFSFCLGAIRAPFPTHDDAFRQLDLLMTIIAL